MLETIVALATAPMKAALAVIRLSGSDCFEITSKVFSRDITKTEKRTIYYGDILNKEENRVIDEVILLAYVAPHSFTGENSVEIICHGSVLIAQEIIAELIKNGARYAVNGEFSSRGFLNKKFDLIQAEAINDAINATTSEAKNLALMSIKGRTTGLVMPIKEKIADILSLIEVNIDYPEFYDIEVATKEKIEHDVSEIVKLLDETLKNGYKGNIIKDGLKVALVGKPNSGKSTLLNSLLKEKKAIVTDIPGTTRDIVEGQISLNGVVLHLMDTAGIRESDNLIEKVGIEKSKEAIENADLILYVVDLNDNEEDQNLVDLIKDKRVIKVLNKSDLNSDFDRKKEQKYAGTAVISALNEDINELKQEILRVLNLKEENYINPSINNMRELGLLEQVKSCLNDALKENQKDMSLDIISVNLTNAYNLVLEILGETADTDVSKEIFARFCVGK